jgi:nitronate monooxygenase
MTILQDLLGIELPIIQAPMAGVQGPALAIAVSNAGGLGSLPCAVLGPDAIRSAVETIRAGTDRPFNMNFFCHRPPERSESVETAWRDALRPHYNAHEIDAEEIRFGTALTPFGPSTAALLEELRPPVASFHFGLPSEDLLARVKATGARVLCSATTVDEAISLEARGVDAIIAQGFEAGGHRGNFLSRDMSLQVGSLSLVPQILRRVTVPVIAAGGIATAPAVAAVLALGAAGVQVGTAYLLCPESDTSGIHRAALKGDASRHTAVTRIFSGRPARAIVNRSIRELDPMSDKAPAFPLGFSAIAALRAKAEAQGSNDYSSLWAGQSASQCLEIPAGDLTRSLASSLQKRSHG